MSINAKTGEIFLSLLLVVWRLLLRQLAVRNDLASLAVLGSRRNGHAVLLDLLEVDQLGQAGSDHLRGHIGVTQILDDLSDGLKLGAGQNAVDAVAEGVALDLLVSRALRSGFSLLVEQLDLVIHEVGEHTEVDALGQGEIALFSISENVEDGGILGLLGNLLGSSHDR